MTIQNYAYRWPHTDLATDPRWSAGPKGFRQRIMPESAEDLAQDSRWPAFFPCPLVVVTTADGEQVLLEKVVGASVVNRFPYTLALSFCKDPLSERHHVRHTFMNALERSGDAAVQFLPPGAALDAAMGAILNLPEEQTTERIARSGLKTRPGRTVAAPVFRDSYMVYECRLVKPGKDFEGAAINAQPFADVGSHRVFFLEITCIQLRQDIATGRNQIRWRALPKWQPLLDLGFKPGGVDEAAFSRLGYVKGYNPDYSFPSSGTTAFEADGVADGMAWRALAPLPEDQIEVDNDRARWPCFFPSPVGMITSWAEGGAANIMPCGSTTIISRQPLVVAPCVSYGRINARYAPRQSLDDIRAQGRFGCGVPFLDDNITAAIRYAGNVSIVTDRDKARNSGLNVIAGGPSPILADLPVHFDCKVVGEVLLGTHVMFLGEVERILAREDVTPANPLEWIPWAELPSGQ